VIAISDSHLLFATFSPPLGLVGMEFQRWERLLAWLESKHMSIADGRHLKVVPGQRQGAGNGLFTTTEVEPYSPLFILPATAKMNVLTLKSHYPDANDLTAVQKITMHLFLHQPSDGGDSQDPLFGPYISVLPRDFDSHPLSWLIRTTSAVGGAPDQSCAREIP